MLKPSFGLLSLSWFATYFNWGATLSYFIDPSPIESENGITLSSLPDISLATYVASGIPAVDGSLGFRSIDFHFIPGLLENILLLIDVRLNLEPLFFPFLFSRMKTGMD